MTFLTPNTCTVKLILNELEMLNERVGKSGNVQVF